MGAGQLLGRRPLGDPWGPLGPWGFQESQRPQGIWAQKCHPLLKKGPPPFLKRPHSFWKRQPFLKATPFKNKGNPFEKKEGRPLFKGHLKKIKNKKLKTRIKKPHSFWKRQPVSKATPFFKKATLLKKKKAVLFLKATLKKRKTLKNKKPKTLMKKTSPPQTGPAAFPGPVSLFLKGFFKHFLPFAEIWRNFPPFAGRPSQGLFLYF